MNKDQQKFVDFFKYCAKCEYKDLTEDDEPCTHCLEDPVNTESAKPTKFKQAGENDD